METCTNCHYSRKLERVQGGHGKAKGHDRLRCQYYPPKVHMGAKAELHETRFPWVEDDDWCGKFKGDD